MLPFGQSVMAYPAQFRKKLFEVKNQEGLTALQVARRFGIGKASVLRWENNLNPVFKRNRPAQKIDMEALKKDIETHPDSYIYERAERFCVSASGMRYALKRWGISRKKNTKTSQSR